jgi:hypothetical protein
LLIFICQQQSGEILLVDSMLDMINALMPSGMYFIVSAL